MAAEQCDVCGAAPDADGDPTCDCAPRTAEEAVAAAFDSFRPLRVRPYFAPNQDDDEPAAPPPPPRQSLIHDPGLPRNGDLSPALTHGAPGHAGWTGGPKAEDVDLFEEDPQPEPEEGEAGEAVSGDTLPVPVGGGDPPSTAIVLHGGPRPPAKKSGAKRKGALIAAAAAVLSIGVIALTTAMGGDGKDDRATPLPTDAGPTASAPEDPDRASSSPSASASSSPSRSPGSSASPSGSASARENEDKGRDKDSPATASTPPRTADGGISVPSSPTQTGSAGGGGGGAEEPEEPKPPTLKEGDSGEEVVELQKRLKQVFPFYWGAEDGEYDSEVTTWVTRYQEENDIEGDPDGVYGPATRKALEAETDEP